MTETVKPVFFFFVSLTLISRAVAVRGIRLDISGATVKTGDKHIGGALASQIVRCGVSIYAYSEGQGTFANFRSVTSGTFAIDRRATTDQGCSVRDGKGREK